jgi:hypothetical protein
VLYIIGNPIAAGLAEGPDDYRWAWREMNQTKDDKDTKQLKLKEG